MRFIFSLLMSVVFFSCQPNTSETPINPPTKKAPQISTSTSSTQQMVDSLRAIYARADFSRHPYQVAERVELMRRKIQAELDAGQPMNLQYYINFCVQSVDAGNLDEALEGFNALVQKMPQFQKIDENSKKFFHTFAIAWMRKGEVENCIVNHSGESCIFPIRGKGIHTQKQYSQNAIKIYEQILEVYPDDLAARWLLNLAYMTIGEYPDKVPAKWLISPKQIQSDYNLPEFSNISMNLGLDINSLAGGIVTDDFNNDGFIDIVASSWGLNDQIRFFKNNGDGTFSDQTEQSGLKGITGGLNITPADYDNDGWLDFLILRGAWYSDLRLGTQPNSLIRNNGDGTFADVTIPAGLYSVHPTQTATWTDFDQDGNLDLFIGNETLGSGEVHPCEFYWNKGNGTFKNIASDVKMNITGFIKGVNSGDVNNDGLPDLYVSFINNPNRLYLNRGGASPEEWKFDEMGKKAGVTLPNSSFPVWFFDYDNDGWEDIFVAPYDDYALQNQAAEVAADYLGKTFLGEHPRLYRNLGNETFEDVTKSARMDRAVHAMGSNYGDLDNDGFLDFYIGTGAPDLRSTVPNRMFRNNGGKTFQDVTTSGRFGLVQKGHAVGFADFDNDGDQDIYTVMGGAVSGDQFQNAFFQNPGNKNNWMVIKLVGATANRSAIGSRIHLELEMQDGTSRHIYRTISPGSSFGANSLEEEIGLGKAKSIKKLEIKWANSNNVYTDYGSVDMTQKIQIKEGEMDIEKIPYAAFQFQQKEHHHH